VSSTPFSRQFFFSFFLSPTGSSSRVVRPLGKRTRPARSLYDQGGIHGYRQGARTGTERDTEPTCGSQRGAYVVLFKIPVDNKKSGTRIGRQHGPDPDADSTETLLRPLHYCTRECFVLFHLPLSSINSG